MIIKKYISWLLVHLACRCLSRPWRRGTPYSPETYRDPFCLAMVSLKLIFSLRFWGGLFSIRLNVGCWPSVFRVDCLSVERCNRHTLCQVLACVSACATWQCVWLLGWLIFLSLLYQLHRVSLFCLRRVLFVSWCL